MYSQVTKKTIALVFAVMFLFFLIVGAGLAVGFGIISVSLSCISYIKENHQPYTETRWIGNNPEIITNYPLPVIRPGQDYRIAAQKSKKTWVILQGKNSDYHYLEFNLCYEVIDSNNTLLYKMSWEIPDDYQMSDLAIKDNKMSINWAPVRYNINFQYGWIGFGFLIILGSFIGFVAAAIGVIKDFYKDIARLAIKKEILSEEDIDFLLDKAAGIQKD